ncbi:MAG: hypothetical protein OEM26_05835 [Saprospiraceae bacterium]|nr:hypothetical protein [Saprospiraceae bacterium]
MDKILQSVGKNLQDVAILFMPPEEQVLFSQSKYFAGTNNLIAFGPVPRQLGLNFLHRPYTPLHTSQCTYLFAASLATIQESQENKKKLWSALKVMFP